MSIKSNNLGHNIFGMLIFLYISVNFEFLSDFHFETRWRTKLAKDLRRGFVMTCTHAHLNPNLLINASSIT